MFFILLNWLNIAFLSYVWGIMLISILERLYKIKLDFFELSFFLGLVLLNFIVNLIALLAPVNLFAQISIQLISLCLAIVLFRKNKIKISLSNQDFKTKKLFVILIGIYLFATTWVRCFFPSAHYDEGLYYIQHVKWIKEYGFVNGLANLHFRLGFNSNLHNLSALFDNFILPEYYFFNDLNGFLFIIFFTASLRGLYALLTEDYRTSNLMRVLALLPLLAPNNDFLCFGSAFVNTLSPDWASYIFVAIVFILIVEGFEQKNEYMADAYFFLASFLALYAFTIKIANISVLLFTLFYFIYLLKKKIQYLYYLLLIQVLPITIWVISNIILSGHILFPISFLAVNSLDWCVPTYKSAYFANETQIWAKTAGNPSVYNSLIFSELFTYWYDNQQTSLKIFYVFFLLSWLLTTIFFVKQILRKNINTYKHLLVVYLICSVGATFWFFTAPDFRFSSAYLVFIPIIFLIILIKHIKRNHYIKYLLVLVCLLFFHVEITLPDIVRAFSHNLPKYSKINVDKKGQINVTKEGDQCFDTPLPCTPYYEENIQQRNIKSLKEGFRIQNN